MPCMGRIKNRIGSESAAAAPPTAACPAAACAAAACPTAACAAVACAATACAAAACAATACARAAHDWGPMIWSAAQATTVIRERVPVSECQPVVTVVRGCFCFGLPTTVSGGRSASNNPFTLHGPCSSWTLQRGVEVGV